MKHSLAVSITSMPFKSKMHFLFNIFLVLFVITIQLYILFFCVEIKFITILLSCIIIFSFIYIAYSNLLQIIKTQNLTQTLEEANIYNHTLEVLHDDMRTFKHDSRNILQCIGGYIDANDITGLKGYYKSIAKDCNHQNSLNSLNPKLIKNPALYSLIVSKYQEAENSSIDFEITILSSLDRYIIYVL